jgi:23S rRNA pseudouridine1911/1915/1917 synthase
VKTLLEWLASRYPAAKRTTLRRMFDDGRVRVNGIKPRSLKGELKPTDDVRVIERPGGVAKEAVPERLPFTIVHEDPDVLVIDKPPGLLTATVPNEHRPTALAAVTKHLADQDPAARVGLIHRLDRDASGLLVFSKHPDAYHSLKRQFFEHAVDRIYHAVVHGNPKRASGRIESRLVELNDGSVHTTKRPDAGEVAVTDFTVIRVAKAVSLLRVTLHTGRKHQIRVHLTEMGHPIVNDPMYSKRRRKGRLMLVASELAFDHPRTGERVRFTATIPREMTARVL